MCMWSVATLIKLLPVALPQDGKSAVMLAAERGKEGYLGALLQEEPDINLVDKVNNNLVVDNPLLMALNITPLQAGKTAVRLAAEAGEAECIRMLAEAGAVVDKVWWCGSQYGGWIHSGTKSGRCGLCTSGRGDHIVVGGCTTRQYEEPENVAGKKG